MGTGRDRGTGYHGVELVDAVVVPVRFGPRPHNVPEGWAVDRVALEDILLVRVAREDVRLDALGLEEPALDLGCDEGLEEVGDPREHLRVLRGPL